MTSFPISEPSLAHSFHQKWGFSVTFSISQPIKLEFGTGIQNWMLIRIFGSKSGFREKYHCDGPGHGNTQGPRWSKTIWKGVLYVKTKSDKVSASYT